jgi:hypothetical protein
VEAVAAASILATIVMFIRTMLSTIKNGGVPMILTKLQEALAEIDAQRAALNDVEAQLRAMIAKLSGPLTPTLVPSPIDAPSRDVRVHARDGIDEIVDILRDEGRSLHITAIAERLSAIKQKPIARTAIEPGLNRHVAKTKEPRVVKVAPSTFGLPEWAQKQSDLGNTA